MNLKLLTWSVPFVTYYRHFQSRITCIKPMLIKLNTPAVSFSFRNKVEDIDKRQTDFLF